MTRARGIPGFYVLYIYGSIYSQEWQGLGEAWGRGEWICHSNGSEHVTCFLLFLSYWSPLSSGLLEVRRFVLWLVSLALFSSLPSPSLFCQIVSSYPHPCLKGPQDLWRPLSFAGMLGSHWGTHEAYLTGLVYSCAGCSNKVLPTKWHGQQILISSHF